MIITNNTIYLETWCISLLASNAIEELDFYILMLFMINLSQLMS